MSPLLSDPWFYAAAVPAVILIGLSKGGFGGAMALLGVPLMALTMPPVQAAGILLPILVLMDWVSLWTWWGQYDTRTLKIMLPGAMIGIGGGWATAALISEDMVRIIVGVVALLFFARWAAQKLTRRELTTTHNRLAGTAWGTLAGFTSFVGHAGGPPYQIYTLPLGQDPEDLSSAPASSSSPSSTR